MFKPLNKETSEEGRKGEGKREEEIHRERGCHTPNPRLQARGHSNCRILIENSLYKHARYLIMPS